MGDYKEIRFLESTSKLREIIQRQSGRELSLERANQTAICLEQGRLFFEAAEKATWEIKPLLVYYGMVGFAKAVYLVRNFGKLESLPASHGLSDVSAPSSPIAEMRLKIEPNGTFHALNDACSKLEKLIFHDSRLIKSRIPLPTCDSSLLQGKELGIKDLLSRIPDLGDLYQKTFGEDPKTTKCSHFGFLFGHEGIIEFDITDRVSFENLNNLENRVRELRAKFPFLDHWRLLRARPDSYLTFANLDRNAESEFLSDWFDESSCSFALKIEKAWHGQEGPYYTPEPTFGLEKLVEHCQPVRGNLTSHIIETTYLIQPFEGLFLSELSLCYLGMFLLSSLVRYRPNVWANALARRSFPEKPAEDYVLVLIEEFVDLGLKLFPEATVVAITEEF